MSYADRPTLVTFSLRTADMAGVPADNADLFAMLISAGREVEIQSMKAVVRLAGAASSFIELCKEDNTVIAKVPVSSAANVGSFKSDGTTAQTYPQTIAAQSTTADKQLKLRVDGTLDATTDVDIQFVVTGMK